MDYALKDLLRVRQVRKDGAETAVTKAQKAVEDAKGEIKKRQKELEDYAQARPAEEKRIFEKIMLKQVTIDAIDAVKAEIAQLREKELALADRVKEAEALLEKAQQDLQQKKEVLAQANKDVDKLLEHRESELKIWNKEQEAKADSELDEFRSKPKG